MNSSDKMDTIEHLRLKSDNERKENWKRWGPYLPERQWGTVREDYSPDSDSWNHFTHDHAISRAYRWGEDGLLGFTDRECRLCLAPVLWNGKDSILKERLFGLSGPEGNHGEDVKEEYFYEDSTPTYSYCKARYKYPQEPFPYSLLRERNKAIGLISSEFELRDTGIFDDNKWFNIIVEYSKKGPNNIFIRFTVTNISSSPATLHLLPTLWFRNSWDWGCSHEGCTVKPSIVYEDNYCIASHPTLGKFYLFFPQTELTGYKEIVFTDNSTNTEELYNKPNRTPYVKDAFHRYFIKGEKSTVNPDQIGTKMCLHYQLELSGSETKSTTLQLSDNPVEELSESEQIFFNEKQEADRYYHLIVDKNLSQSEKLLSRRAAAGLLWSKQFYHYVVKDWLLGDPDSPSPPEKRKYGRNSDWKHLFNRDIISVPDKWEYPWFAAWDLAFHMVPMAKIDINFAREQMLLLLREWYMHPNGQLPAYEYNFSNVNPPVHAWGVWKVYKAGPSNCPANRKFLESSFQKLIINFTWWVNKKDPTGKNLFSGGFLGMDNIGIFDRSSPLPTGGALNQADGTSWMAFYCLTMLKIAIELAQSNQVYEDLASKFFEHYVAIAEAMNTCGGSGLWNEEDSFYYDQIRLNGESLPLRTRSLVGLLPLIAVEVLEEEKLQKLPGFMKRMKWFLTNRPELKAYVSFCESSTFSSYRLFSMNSRQRFQKLLSYLLDEEEFLSSFGIRSLSRYHEKYPSRFQVNDQVHEVRYNPDVGDTNMFGGNSNWRGPVWFPINYLLIEALQKYHLFYGNAFLIEYPTNSNSRISLSKVPEKLSRRVCSLLSSEQTDYDKDSPLFYEFFNPETGAGLGASHQTGWTALVINLPEIAAGKSDLDRL